MKYSAKGTILKKGAALSTATSIAQVEDIDGPGIALETEKLATHDDDWYKKIPTMLDGGSLKFTIEYDPAQASHNETATGLMHAIKNKELATYFMVFPTSPISYWQFDAYVTGFSPKAPVKGALTAEITMDVDGEPLMDEIEESA